jgi:post-segregation antitoxin (ccd killing protein)
MTIYLPHELAERVKAEDDLNVSGVCQEALEAELGRRARLTQLDEGMNRVTALKDGVTVSFAGRRLASDDRGRTVYLTARHRIAIVDNEGDGVWDYDNLDDAEAEDVDPVLLAQAAYSLGEERVVELDI